MTHAEATRTGNPLHEFVAGMDAMVDHYVRAHPEAAPLHAVTPEILAKCGVTFRTDGRCTTPYHYKGYTSTARAQKTRRQREHREKLRLARLDRIQARALGKHPI